VVSEPGLDVARLLQSALEEGLDALLCGGPTERGEEGVPLRGDLGVGRQAVDVDEARIPAMCLVELEILRANASTKSSRSASGSDRLT
jgi:hypothetical protein